MKLSSLQFSCGLSLVCHAVAFGLFTYCGQVLRHAELRSEDLALTMTFLVAPEASPVQPAVIASVTAPAPPVESAQPPVGIKSPQPLLVADIPEPIVTLPEPVVLQPQPASPTIVVASDPSRNDQHNEGESVHTDFRMAE